jgi:hypothetical protein
VASLTAFLVGEGLDEGHPGDWYKGHTVWIACNDISMIAEFADLESYQERVQP